MTPSPQDVRPDRLFVADAPATADSSFTFNTQMYTLTAGASWRSSLWAGGTYGGRVYYSYGASTVTIALPAPHDAIYFYATPNEHGTFLMEATATDGSQTSSGPVTVTTSAPGWGPSGQYFGFYGTGGENIETVTVSYVDTAGYFRDFAVGNFALSASRYAFTGFFAPIDNGGVLNVVRAGSTVPVKFSLDGDQGLAIFAEGSPSSRPIPCDPAASQDLIEETTTAGSSTLSYDAASDQYRYAWQTSKSWAGTCRELTVTLSDGTSHTALFDFRR